ncbi:Aldo/keto reductase [Trametes cingulata]|nr:Aldo/keto reductase [Trametes cingulata]
MDTLATVDPCYDPTTQTRWLYYSPDGRRERDCALDFLRRWPDRTGLYSISLRPRGFKLTYADSSGAISSDVIPWDSEGLKRLSDYVYSLYYPPARHFLRDLTMIVHEHRHGAVWSIRANGEMFPDARHIFLAQPGGKRTAVFLAGHQSQQQAIIKDSYRKPLDYYEEPTFLKHIHRRGFVPGVIRLAHEEIVYFAGEADIVSVRRSPQVKHRMVLADMGESLLLARSVNDLLMAIFDSLEVHRTLASHARILHRDMSLSNILMYPRWARCTNTQVLEGVPPLIDDILHGEVREPAKRTARCLLIDFDFASRLPSSSHAENIPGELRHRVGTPMYVARSVAVGRVLFVRHVPLRMPTLTGDAQELYVKAYGQERYDQYCDDFTTYHGGIPEDGREDAWGSSARCRSLRFHHRWEHDVESVYWTMYSALLRVRPRGYVDDERTKDSLHRYWRMLRSHEFLEGSCQDCENLPQDTRTPLLDCDHDAFLKPFPPIMRDVARLLFDIAQHVRISYAAMSVLPKYEDHLHEAVQRLILEYLVRHNDDPIWLNPDELRISDTPQPVFRGYSTRPSTNEDYMMASEDSGEHDDQYLSGDPAPPPPTPLGRYRKLAPIAGVHVSPICLGAMSIGDKWEKFGMGAMNKESSFKLLDAFYAAGGNFIDTANGYQDESSEEFLGEWMELRGIRDQMIIATKYTTNYKRGATDIPQKANYTGNNLKSLHLSVEDSLKKLRTNYVDILYVHWWDFDTTMEEVMNGLHNLVVSGKVLYLGISDTPAWIVSKANLYARLMGKTPFVIYQGAWSILQRDFEREIIPMAREEGLALAPWNVLAAGRIRTDEEEERRRQTGEKGKSLNSRILKPVTDFPVIPDWERTEDEKKVCRALEEVAKQVGAKSIQAVAIAYVMQKTPYVFPIIGGRKVEQLEANIEALNVALSEEQIKYLESILPFDAGFPHTMIGDGTAYNRMMAATAVFDKWPRAQAIRPSPN